jgi:YHS domain-containing protein
VPLAAVLWSGGISFAGVMIFATLFWLTARRGATDPVCGMKVDCAKAATKSPDGQALYFCSDKCLQAFEAGPAQHREAHCRPTEQRVARHHGGVKYF